MSEHDNPHRNPEHYRDETAHDALASVALEEKAAQAGQDESPHPPVKARPLVYICSPYRGATESNARRARNYCRFAIGKRAVPFAPHLLYTQFLDDTVRKERNIGISCGITVLRRCNEMWVFGDHITAGMKAEINMAQELGIPIRRFTHKITNGGEYEPH